jgi:hypothetical protein
MHRLEQFEAIGKRIVEAYLAHHLPEKQMRAICKRAILSDALSGGKLPLKMDFDCSIG